MDKAIFLSSFLIILFSFSGGFKDSQLKNSRVKSAYAKKQSVIDEMLLISGLQLGSLSIFIRAFKN